MLQTDILESRDQIVSRRVRSDGAQIHYRMFNEAGHGDGLLLTHGMMAHSHWWDEIAPGLTGRFRVAAMDTAGMGDSDHRDRYTARGLAEDLVAVIRDARFAPATIVAHSFSGNMALHACALAPELICRVVIIDSRIHFPDLPVLLWDERVDANVTRKFYPTREDAVARYRLFNRGLVSPERLRHVAEQGLTQTESGWTWKFDPAFDAELSDDPDRAIPSGITTPVDYIYGEESELEGAFFGGQLRQYVKNCGVPIAVPGYGHNMMLQAPGVVVALLRALFARHVA